MKKDITLVILAAGMGSRFGGLKQIEGVGPNDEFLIDYSVYDAINAGFTKIVFIIKEENYKIFKETIGKRVEPHINVEYCFQKNDNIKEGLIPSDRTKPLGTAHALLCAKDKVNENFAIISADDFYGKHSFEIIAKNLKESDDFNVVGYKLGDTLSEKGSVKRGVCMEKDGYLSDIIESKAERIDNKVSCTPLSGADKYEVELDHPVSMLKFGMTPVIFDTIENEINEFFENNQDNIMECEYLIPDVLDKMLKENKIKIKVLPTTSKWYGMTYREDLDIVRNAINELIKAGEYPEKLWD